MIKIYMLVNSLTSSILTVIFPEIMITMDLQGVHTEYEN